MFIPVNIVDGDMYGQVLLLAKSKDAGEVDLPEEVGSKVTFQELKV